MLKLSIIVPVFNEEKTIYQVVSQLVKLVIVDAKKEIIVVNDGSIDLTEEKLTFAAKKFKQIKIIHHAINQGKGAAVKTGMEQAEGNYILIQDADLEYDPLDIAKLIEPIKMGKALIVYGTRLKRLPNFSQDERTPQFFIHYLGNKFLSLVTSILYGQWITDMETGYKLFPKNLAQSLSLKAKSFDFEPEITAKFLKHGFTILEVPIETNPRGYAQGKKLNTIKDGLAAFYTLVKYRFFD